MNALQGVVGCLENGTGEVFVEEPVRSQALGCIERMLDFVVAHPQAVAKRDFDKIRELAQQYVAVVQRTRKELQGTKK